MRGYPSAPSSLNSRGSGVSPSLARRVTCPHGWRRSRRTHNAAQIGSRKSYEVQPTGSSDLVSVPKPRYVSSIQYTERIGRVSSFHSHKDPLTVTASAEQIVLAPHARFSNVILAL